MSTLSFFKARLSLCFLPQRNRCPSGPARRPSRLQRGIQLALILLTSTFATNAAPPICVLDDLGETLCLNTYAARIIALSPSATELLYAAGAGDKLVGAVSFSDYPTAAQALPRVGSYNRFDLETILALQPDLIVAWREGNPKEQVAKLKQLGLPIFYSNQQELTDIPQSIRRMGKLAGVEETAKLAASNFLQRLQTLHAQYADRPPVKSFYQVWKEPLMTANQTHFIGRALSVCGGENIFADLNTLTPRVQLEAVLAANPEAILAGGMGEDDPSWLEDWRQYPQLLAVKRKNLFFIPPSLIQRPTPRLLQGIELVCQHLETAREHR